MALLDLICIQRLIIFSRISNVVLYLNAFCPDPQADLSSLLSEAFVRFFVELVGHYPLHMVESFNGTKELQRDSFRKSHPSRGARQFLQLFMDTQMFAGFIQDKELRKGGGRRGELMTP